MMAVQATFDGGRVILPSGVPAHRPGQVIVLFDDEAADPDAASLAAAQQSAFAKVWDNPEDAVYDEL